MVYRTAPVSMTLNNPKPSFQGYAILWRWISHKRSKIRPYIYYGRRIGNRTQAFEWYQFDWTWVTSNPDFKVTIIQRQITRKWYNTEHDNDSNVLDFVVNRFFMKLFRTNNIGMVKECQSYFSFQLPTEMLKQRTERFDIKFKRLSASWL